MSNPYIHEGARVRHRNTGKERVVADYMYGLLRFKGEPQWTYFAAHYKPVVRVKMGRRHLDPGVHDDARPGDVVYRADWSRYANVYEAAGTLRMSPWWAHG